MANVAGCWDAGGVMGGGMHGVGDGGFHSTSVLMVIIEMVSLYFLISVSHLYWIKYRK